LRESLDLLPVGGDQCELAGDEEAVGEDQDQYGEQT
jgi:hypothetical protein